MCAGGSEKHLHRPKRSDWDCHWSSSLPGVWTVGINPKEEGRRRRSQQNSCRCCLAKALRRWEESGRRRKRWPEAEKRVSSGLSPRWLLLTPTWNQPWPSSTARHHRHLSPACAAVPLGRRKATASRQNVANGPSNVLCFFPFPVARPSFSITRWKSPRFLLASYYGNWARHLITVNSSCRPTQQIPGRQNRKSHGKGEKRKTFPRCLVASSSSSLASLYMFNAPWMATEAEGTGRQRLPGVLPVSLLFLYSIPLHFSRCPDMPNIFHPANRNNKHRRRVPFVSRHRHLPSWNRSVIFSLFFFCFSKVSSSSSCIFAWLSPIVLHHFPS